MEDHTHHAPPAEQSKLRQYRPLILVLGAILIIAGAIELLVPPFSGLRAMRNFMGLFFVTFAAFKLIDLKGFAIAYADYDIIAKRSRGYGYLYPFIELALGALYLTNAAPIPTNIATIIVMGIGSIGVAQALWGKQRIHCACLGAVVKLPMTTVTLIEDLGMVAMAIVMLVLQYY